MNVQEYVKTFLVSPKTTNVNIDTVSWAYSYLHDRAQSSVVKSGRLPSANPDVLRFTPILRSGYINCGAISQ